VLVEEYRSVHLTSKADPSDIVASLSNYLRDDLAAGVPPILGPLL
jgi:hypothetical protein